MASIVGLLQAASGPAWKLALGEFARLLCANIRLEIWMKLCETTSNMKSEKIKGVGMIS